MFCAATSIDVERVFSLAGRVLTKLRNRLNDENTQTCVILSSWLSYPAFNAEIEMRKKLSELWKREKRQGNTPSEVDNGIEVEDGLEEPDIILVDG